MSSGVLYFTKGENHLISVLPVSESSNFSDPLPCLLHLSLHHCPGGFEMPLLLMSTEVNTIYVHTGTFISFLENT